MILERVVEAGLTFGVCFSRDEDELFVQIGAAEAALKVRHPNAPWLATGGAHTGGTYYTISIESIDFLDMYGGPAPITVAEYLAAPSPGDQ